MYAGVEEMSAGRRGRGRVEKAAAPAANSNMGMSGIEKINGSPSP